MHLQLCRRCGAIDNVSAVACYKCGASFSSRGDDENARPEAEHVASAPANATPGGSTVAASARNAAASPRTSGTAPVRPAQKRKGGAASALLFVVIAAVAVFLYRTYAPSEEGGGGDAARAHTGRSSPGTIDATLGAVPPSAAILAAEGGTQPVPAIAQPIAADDPPLPVDATQPAAAADASSATGMDGSGAPPGAYPCTPEVAALGLCN